MAFQDKTRRKVIRLGQQGYAAVAGGGLLTWDIPKTGLLAGILVHCFIDTSAAGWAAALTAKGIFACAVDRIRLVANSGIDIINMSGSMVPIFAHYQEAYNTNVDAVTLATVNQMETAAAAGSTYICDFYLPVSINRRDPLGMFMLQNEATLLQLQITVRDAVTAGGAGGTYDDIHFVPSLEIFTVPADPKDWPPLNVVHQLVEDTRAVAAAGVFQYQWPRGNTYAQVIHACDLGAALAFAEAAFTAADLTVNQSDRLYDYTNDTLDIEHQLTHGFGYPRHAGVIAFDFLGSSGLGCFGSARDMLYSAMVTELVSNITFTGAGQLTTLRRQLVALKG